METRIQMIVEDLESIHEMHEEYADLIPDVDDRDAIEIWIEIEKSLGRVSRAVDRIRNAGSSTAENLDQIEDELEELNESYGELASLL